MALGYEAIKCVLHIMNVVRFMKVWLDHMDDYIRFHIFRLQTFKWMYNALISSNPRKDFRMYFLQPSSLLPLLMYFSDILARKECTTGVAELN